MYFTSNSISTLTAFMMVVNAVALPQSNGLTLGASAAPGDSCDISGQRVCNGARDAVLSCLGAPGTALKFVEVQACIEGFQVCTDGNCFVDKSEPAEQPLPGDGGEGGDGGLTIGNGNTTDE